MQKTTSQYTSNSYNLLLSNDSNYTQSTKIKVYFSQSVKSDEY